MNYGGGAYSIGNQLSSVANLTGIMTNNDTRIQPSLNIESIIKQEEYPSEVSLHLGNTFVDTEKKGKKKEEHTRLVKKSNSVREKA